MVLMILTLTSWCAIYLPTYLHSLNSRSSLCNSSEEHPLATILGKMDGESFLLFLCDTQPVRKDIIGRQNCPVTVFTLCSSRSSVEWLFVFLQ